MGLLKKIVHVSLHAKLDELHLAAENKPFLQRYLNANGALKLKDHYNYLIQLHLIHTVFAERLSHPNFTPPFSEHLKFLLTRVQAIQEDLTFLAPFISSVDKNNLMKATVSYADTLRKIPGTTEGNFQLLGHFLVAILGDLNGGVFLKMKVNALYKDNLIGTVSDNEGVRFYSFPPKTLSALDEWLQVQIPYSDSIKTLYCEGVDVHQIIGGAALEAFQHQTNIVEELETQRTKEYSPGLFSCNKLTQAAITLAVAGIGAGVAFAISRFGN